MSGLLQRKKFIQCTEHADNILEKLQTFYNQRIFFDVTLIAGVDNTKIRAHRTVLCAASDYFLEKFLSYSNESTLAEVNISDFNGTTLRSILNFMYLASIELDSETVESVLKAAVFLKINTLVIACCDFMVELLHPRNCLGFASYADKHGYMALSQKSWAFAYKNFKRVCAQMEFLQLSENELNKFFSGDDLIVVSQEHLFHSLVAWFQYDEQNRRDLMYNLLSRHVRFALLNPRFIVKNRAKLNHISECSDLFYKWIDWHLSPEKIVFTYWGIDDIELAVRTFNPESKRWSNERWPNPSNNQIHYSTLVVDNKFIISGGEIDNMVTNKVEYLDLQLMQWYELPSMASKRRFHNMAEINGNLYVLGGEDENASLSSVEKYNFSSGKWKYVNPLPEAPGLVKLSILNGLLYVASMYDYHLQCYDPRTKTWTKTASRNNEFSGFGLAACNRYLYAIGGVKNMVMSKTVERYNPRDNTWTQINPSKYEGRWSVCTWNDRLIACVECKNIFNVLLEEFDPEKRVWKSIAPNLPTGRVYSCLSQLSIIK